MAAEQTRISDLELVRQAVEMPVNNLTALRAYLVYLVSHMRKQLELFFDDPIRQLFGIHEPMFRRLPWEPQH